jgi:AhpD family alkylhydroperoxidase
VRDATAARRVPAGHDTSEKYFGCMSHAAGLSRLAFREFPQRRKITMKPRLNLFALASSNLMKPLLDFGNAITQNGLEPNLMELVKMRASQINGCAFCLDMHSRDARKNGETEARLYLLNAWRESPLYSDRERAALGWTEALTLVAETHAPDDVYEALKAQFTEEEQVKLTMMIVAINGWNRLNVGFRTVHPVRAERSAA